MAESAYLTDVWERPDENNLRKYVDKLDSKIDYAKWKQSLVLSYNYMPLQTIREKIDTERRAYLKKMDDQENRLRQVIESKDIMNQLDLFREFSGKLTTKMKEIQIKIEAERMKLKVLSAEADDKKSRLKETLRENMNLAKLLCHQQGITSRTDLARLSRTQSYKEKVGSVTSRGRSKVSRTTKYDSINSFREAKSSYDDCVEAMIKALRSMKSSDDVQTGIYLEIMNRKVQEEQPKPRYSTKSKICHTLMDRYRSLNTGHKREQEDFWMPWETFKCLNWKQIMGIVLVKDPSASALKTLLSRS